MSDLCKVSPLRFLIKPEASSLPLRLFWLSICAVLVLMTLSLAVKAQGGQSILIRNAVLINREGGPDQATVNILIRDSKLEILSEDFIPLSEADVSYDATGGTILGELTPGQPPSFLILDGDPRQNIRLLLDTKAHASFAIYQGNVIKNTFVPIAQETPEDKAHASRDWLAYAPPPLAVPLDYQNNNRWNKFNTRYVSGIFTGAVVLDRQNWQEQSDSSEFQVGDLKAYDGGEIRGLRFGGVGTLNFENPWIWTVFGATHAFDKGFDSTESDDYTLFDLRLDIPLWEKVSLSIGKQKEPISMERIMKLGEGPLGERAAVSDALLPSRNVGVVIAGTLLDERMTLATGAFNNWLDKDQPDSFSDNATQFVGRTTWTPLFSQNESTLLHLGLGLRHSNSKQGFVTQTGPEFNQAPDYVATQFMEPDSMMTYQAEASLRSGPYWLHSEYVRTELDNPVGSDTTLDGYHLTASWIITGEVRPYNRRVGVFKSIPIARTVEQNGWGAWEVSTRFSNFDMSDALDPDGADAGDMDIWSFGLNWWLTPYMNFNVNYRYITLDRFGKEASSRGFNSRIMMILN